MNRKSFVSALEISRATGLHPARVAWLGANGYLGTFHPPGAYAPRYCLEDALKVVESYTKPATRGPAVGGPAPPRSAGVGVLEMLGERMATAMSLENLGMPRPAEAHEDDGDEDEGGNGECG